MNMTKNKSIIISILITLLTLNANVYAQDEHKTEMKGFQEPEIVEVEVIEIEGQQYKKEVALIETRSENIGDNESMEDLYLIDIEPISPAYVIEDTQTGTYTFNRLSYAIKCTANVKYEVYKSTKSGDMGTYYKIRSFYFAYTSIETPCKPLSTTIAIHNNGVTDGTAARNQDASKSLGTSKSGTVYGSSSWTPSTTGGLLTCVRMDATIQRGSSNYDIYWQQTY